MHLGAPGRPTHLSFPLGPPLAPLAHLGPLGPLSPHGPRGCRVESDIHRVVWGGPLEIPRELREAHLLPQGVGSHFNFRPLHKIH